MDFFARSISNRKLLFMEKTSILQASLLDIVFDERNKVYGAYELRSKYTQRLSKALLVTGAIASVILLASFVGSKMKSQAKHVQLDITDVSTTKLADDPIVEPPPPPKQKPIEQPRVAMIQFTPPRLVHEEIDPKDQMKNVDEIDQAKISTKNVDGIKAVDIAAPPIDENSGVITGPKAQPKDEPFSKVEIEASFPGGEDEWKKYISKEIGRYTDELQEDGKAGTCTVQFIVDVNGVINDIEVLTMKGSKLAEICANAVRKGPKWIPAIQNGNKVKAYRRQPVTFRIDNP